MMYAICFLCGFGAALSICCMIYESRRQKAIKKGKNTRAESLKKLNTLLKLLVTVSVIHGMVLTTMSYVLAFFDKNTVESVSSVIVSEIIAPIAIYALSKTVENIFQKNKLKFSTPISIISDGVDDDPKEG